MIDHKRRRRKNTTRSVFLSSHVMVHLLNDLLKIPHRPIENVCNLKKYVHFCQSCNWHHLIHNFCFYSGTQLYSAPMQHSQNPFHLLNFHLKGCLIRFIDLLLYSKKQKACYPFIFGMKSLLRIDRLYKGWKQHWHYGVKLSCVVYDRYIMVNVDKSKLTDPFTKVNRNGLTKQ